MESLTLEDYVAAIEALIDEGKDAQELVREIVPLKQRLLAGWRNVPESFSEGLGDVPYTRNLLHADAEGRFTVMAIVWGGRCSTPVHDHESWGVIGVLREPVAVVNYKGPEEGHGNLEPLPAVTLDPGAVATVVPPRSQNIHKMLNPTDRPAVTIHTYGDPAKLCRVYDPATGRTKQMELQFHHAL
ncbi:MAG TPA: hypothetical protein ENK43_05000 [Planctomycetes bacterium]|nr:hypothetical protein [Planctomycetota bacterium]